MRADEDSLEPGVLSELLDALIVASEQLDYETARDILLRVVKEYAPSNGIDDFVWLRKSGSDVSAEDRTVVDFPKSSQ